MDSQDEFLTIKTGGILILGQEQDALGGFFDDDQSFSGEISEFFWFHESLSDETIAGLSNCNANPGNVTDSSVVTWDEFLDEWTFSKVEKNSLTLDTFCSARIMKDYLVWADQVTYTQISDYCRRLDGELVRIDSQNSLESVHALAYGMLETVGTKFYSKCTAGDHKVKFWIRDPNLTESYQDLSDYDCPYVFGERIERGLCGVKFPCGICKLPPGSVNLNESTKYLNESAQNLDESCT